MLNEQANFTNPLLLTSELVAIKKLKPCVSAGSSHRPMCLARLLRIRETSGFPFHDQIGYTHKQTKLCKDIKKHKSIFLLPFHPAISRCFCPKEPCPLSGLFNVSKCQFGSPLMLSWPHFFQVATSFLWPISLLLPGRPSFGGCICGAQSTAGEAPVPDWHPPGDFFFQFQNNIPSSENGGWDASCGPLPDKPGHEKVCSVNHRSPKVELHPWRGFCGRFDFIQTLSGSRRWSSLRESVTSSFRSSGSRFLTTKCWSKKRKEIQCLLM